MNDIDVLIRVATDAADGARGLDDIGDAARDMADDVDRASRDAADHLERITDAADGVASTTTTLAGAFGDIGGGLEAVGLDGFADKLNGTATALMFVAGVADTASVAMNSLSIAKIKDTAATVGQRAASIASTVATSAQTAAQWALNAAMSANPILIVVLAVAALVAGFVLAYKKSATFRAIVQAVGRAGRAAIGWVVDKIRDLVRWVGDTAPKAWNRMKAIASTALSVITAPLRTWISLFSKAVTWLKEKIPDAARALKRIAVPVFEALATPIRTVVDLIKDVVNWVKKIDLGPIDDLAKGLGKVGKSIGGALGKVLSSSTGAPVGAPTTNVQIPITVNGAVDPVATAQQLSNILGGQLRRYGSSSVWITP